MDYAEELKKYVKEIDETALAGMEKTYRLVLSNSDSALVAYSDPKELETMKENFLVKKLGLSETDALDEGISAVGDQLKGVNRKNRLVVYYLLAHHFNKLSVFH